jgi:hypothetical protein
MCPFCKRLVVAALSLAVGVGCPVTELGGTTVVASAPSGSVGSRCVCDDPHVPDEGRAPSGAPYGLPYNPTVSTITTSLAQVFLRS